MWATGPYASMKRSRVIIIVSAASTSAQLLPKTLSEEDATAYPWPSMKSSITPAVPGPWRYQPSVQPPPKL